MRILYISDHGPYSNTFIRQDVEIISKSYDTLYLCFEEHKLYITITVLFIFGFVFAVNSSLHSFLILKYTDKNRVTLDVGFYYMSNAFGRLIGTLLSGLSIQFGGFLTCIFITALMLALNRLSMEKLDLKNI